jgi:hypothetical protein
MEHKEKISRCNRSVKQILRAAAVIEATSYDMSFEIEQQDELYEMSKKIKLIADKVHALVGDYERMREASKNYLPRMS